MKRPLVVLVALLIIAVVLGLVRGILSGGHGGSLSPFATMGQMAAEETARLVNDSGRVAVLIGKHGSPSDTFAEQGPILTAFRQTLKQHRHISIALDADQPSVGPMGISATDFLDFVNRHSDVDAIISFVGAPPLSNAEIAALPAKR